MSEQRRKLHDILVLCILRYGQTQDNRFALAALVAYQALQEVLRPEAISYVEEKLREIQDRVVATVPQQTSADVSYSTLAAFVRSTGLLEALKDEGAAQVDSHKAKMSLHRIARELAEAIETFDLHAAYVFLKPACALRAAA